MRIDINVYLHPDGERVFRRLDELAALITNLGIAMTKELDALQLEVERNTTVDQSAIVLLKGLADQIVALKNDPVKLQQLANDLKTSSSALADAVAANTVAESPA